MTTTSKYLVHLRPGMAQVIISLDGFGPTAGEGLKELGSFTLDVDPLDNQLKDPQAINQKGDHLLVVKAREVLEDHLGGKSSKDYTFVDRASNAVVTDEDANMSTNAIPVVDGEGARDAEASAQAGGEKNAATHEIHADVQNDGDKADTPPAAEAAGETEGGPVAGEATGEKSETVADLKTRIAGITDKAELQKVYDDEVAGADRTTAKAAIEARAAELEA